MTFDLGQGHGRVTRVKKVIFNSFRLHGMFMKLIHMVALNPRLYFCNMSNHGGFVATPSLDFRTEPLMKLILVSIGRYGPSLFIHTKISTISQGVT